MFDPTQCESVSMAQAKAQGTITLNSCESAVILF